MRFRRLVALGLTLVLGTGLAFGQRKRKKKEEVEPITQTLPVLQDPPQAVTAESARLSFRVAPLSGKGLLSQQVRDGLKALVSAHRGAPIVKLRAFVAGTGDMRRVREIVREVFTEKRVSLPAVTTVQAGALPLEGAQVILESTAVERKDVNPHGIAILRSMPIEEARKTLESVGLSGNRVLRATCYTPSLDGFSETRTKLQTDFPSAAVNIVQMQRLPVRATLSCEIIAALERTPDRLEIREALVLVPPSKLVITATQLAFRAQEADIRLAFERLSKTLEGARVGYPDVIAATVYPLAEDVAAKVATMQFEFFSKQRPPVISSVMLEGLPSMDASFGVEVIARAN